MRFTVGVEGSAVPIPAPESIDELVPFVEALHMVRAGGGVPFTRTLPPKQAGSFGIAVGAADGGRDTRFMIDPAKPFDGPSHHTARMRVAELVVDYFPGPPHPDSRLSYGAVFKASEEADALFALAEPPTHDDWIPKGLSGTARGVVVGARAFVQKQADEYLGLGFQTGGEGGQGLGQLAALLASVVPDRFTRAGVLSKDRTDDIDDDKQRPEKNTGGRVATVDDRYTGGGHTSAGRAPRPVGKARLLGAPALQVHQNRPYFVAAVKVPESGVARVVSVSVDVIIEGGGREGEPPLGAAVPQVIEWRSTSGDVIVPGRSIKLPAGGESDWYVYATYAPDAVVRFRVEQVTADAD
jgi:hypothetical protein